MVKEQFFTNAEKLSTEILPLASGLDFVASNQILFL